MNNLALQSLGTESQTLHNLLPDNPPDEGENKGEENEVESEELTEKEDE